MNTKLLINGKLVAGKGAKEDVLDPATGKPLVTVAEASPEQIESAVAAAAKAFPAWSATVPKDRAALLLKIADRIEAEAADYARLESQNCGKPYAAVLNDEIPAIVDVFRFFAGAARTLHGAVAGEYLPGFTSMIRRDPVGVVASIAPWNYPLMMAAWKLSPALAGGNTIVLKPSEQTPLTTLKLATLLAELFPPGVVNIVHGRGPTVGASLISQPQVAMISLTGDVSTGEKVLQAAAKGAKRTHLELGGKAPVIVFDDADRDAVVSGVRTFGFYNAGQDCTAACRIYAGPKIYDKLVADLTSAAASIKVGKQDEEGVEMGPLISAKQRSRVAGFVNRADKSRHIEITTGGKSRGGGGFFFEPTVIAGAKQSDEIVRREVFGPVVSVTRFKDADQAIAVGERLRLRPGVVGVDQRRRQGDARRGAAAVRLHVDQHAFHAGERDAARRPEALRLRQGPVGVRARGLHRAAARDGQAVGRASARLQSAAGTEPARGQRRCADQRNQHRRGVRHGLDQQHRDPHRHVRPAQLFRDADEQVRPERDLSCETEGGEQHRDQHQALGANGRESFRERVRPFALGRAEERLIASEERLHHRDADRVPGERAAFLVSG